MEEKISLRTQLSRFATGTYNFKNVETQIAAGWFDWFCEETLLARKTPHLYKILQKISASPKLNLDMMYAFFKNNCPAVGSLYDSISICDLKTGDVLFWIAPTVGYGVNKGKAEMYDIRKGTEVPDVCGTVKDIVTWFNVGVSAKMKEVYDEFGVLIFTRSLPRCNRV